MHGACEHDVVGPEGNLCICALVAVLVAHVPCASSIHTFRRILSLVLTADVFEATRRGVKLKPTEMREDNAWIRSRLCDANGNPRDFDFIDYYRAYTSTKIRRT